MSIAVFVDVDQVLTKYSVQMQYATLLGVADQLRGVENAYREGKATNAEFNDTLIPLFRSKGFTLGFAKDNFDEIDLQPWAKSLLMLRNVDIFLISSGPNYYVRTMAENWNIPQENVLCSEYVFDNDDILFSCNNQVSLHGKAEFVKERNTGYDITIGLGDNLEQDSLFLSHCTIPILTTPTEEYISARKLESVLMMIQKLAPMFPVPEKRRPIVFIGSSTEAINVAEAVQIGIQYDAESTIWTQGVFKPGHGTLDSLVELCTKSDFAVLVFSPDDVLEHREEVFLSVRDNVLFEFGLFMGRLGASRTFFLYPREKKIKIPTDLAGIVPLNYTYSKNLEAALGPACTQIKKAIRTLGLFALRAR
jgi:phosphoserine phosphatase